MSNQFKPGDRVRVDDGPHAEYKVLDGPFMAYRVKAVGAEAETVRASTLEHIPPADPRVDVVADVISESDDLPTAEDVARAVLAALDAHSETACKYGRCNEVAQCSRCDMDAAAVPRRVRDRDGDVWEWQESGVYEMQGDGASGTYGYIADTYGPLTPLEA